jgi:DNA (cytosine-5)-methyltransferase 1
MKTELRVVSLFSGGGLGDFGFVMAGCEIVAQVEIDEYCQKILELRYPDAKKFRDIRTVKGSDLPECDIITGGFPCQPFSVSGKQRGKDDNRHLWPEMFRIISEVRPTWVVGENVSGFIKLALDDVLADLESIGYEATAIVFPAHALGAPHRRERVWIIANADSNRLQRQHPISSTAQRIIEEWDNISRMVSKIHKREINRLPESCICRKSNRPANLVDRLKLLGNGQVPACTKWIAENIIEFERVMEKESVGAHEK